MTAKQRAALIRQWAREHDYEIAEKGPIPDDIVAGYKADDKWLLTLRDTVLAELVTRNLAPRGRREVPYPPSALGKVRYRKRGRTSRWRSMDNPSLAPLKTGRHSGAHGSIVTGTRSRQVARWTTMSGRSFEQSLPPEFRS